MTRDERIKSFQDNVFNTILDPNGISKENFEYLLEVIPAYLKAKLNIEEINIKYVDAGDCNGVFIPEKNTIELYNFTYKEKELEKLVVLADLIKTCTHEIYHALDERERSNSGSYREDQAARHKQGIKYLSHFFPEKKEQYEEFATIMYAISRSECFARKGALITFKNFVVDMRDFVLNKLEDQNLGEKMEQIEEYIQKVEKTGDYENIPNVEPSGWAAYEMIKKYAIFKTKSEYEEDMEKRIMQLAITKRSMLPEIKEDIFKASEKVKASWNQIHEPYSEKILMYIASTQELADFYNKETLENFTDYATFNSGKKGLMYVCRCARLEEIKRQEMQNIQKGF